MLFVDLVSEFIKLPICGFLNLVQFFSQLYSWILCHLNHIFPYLCLFSGDSSFSFRTALLHGLFMIFNGFLLSLGISVRMVVLKQMDNKSFYFPVHGAEAQVCFLKTLLHLSGTLRPLWGNRKWPVYPRKVGASPAPLWSGPRGTWWLMGLQINEISVLCPWRSSGRYFWEDKLPQLTPCPHNEPALLAVSGCRGTYIFTNKCFQIWG